VRCEHRMLVRAFNALNLWNLCICGLFQFRGFSPTPAVGPFAAVERCSRSATIFGIAFRE
jgi:hypothetical protein